MKRNSPGVLTEDKLILIGSYLRGNLSEEQYAEAKNVLLAYWADPKVQALLNEAPTAADFFLKANEIAAAEQRLIQEIKLKQLVSSSRKRFYQPYWLVAASLLLVVSTNLLVINKIHFQATPKFFNVSKEAPFAENVKPATKKLVTPWGKRASYKLADGSEVELNSGSSLQVADDYGKSVRRVYLSGEAFFRVIPNPAIPFYVDTETEQIRVVGTSFNVRSYSADNQHSVSVATGKVEVDTRFGTGKAELLPGWRITIYPATKQAITSRFKMEEAGKWRDGRLEFHKATLQQVAVELQRWYGIPIKVFNNELSDCLYTATLDQLPVARVLADLSYTGGFKYEIKADSILIDGSFCNK